MKLVVQIPCLNEEKSLGDVLSEIPKNIKGIDIIEVQIIDDGSSDKTVEIAKKYGVNRIITHKRTRGLGVSFSDGVEAALTADADILVNTDGDNQYPGKYISDLVKPVVEGLADMVIADRQTRMVSHFSSGKKFLQWLGSATVRSLSGTGVPDAVSGFRAYSRESLMMINTVSKFSYCIDTIIQAGKKGLKVVSVPIVINKPTRESRLFKSTKEHVFKSTINLLKMFVVYEPFKTFLTIAILFVLPAIFFMGRFAYFYLFNAVESKGHIQSLIIGSAFLTASFQMLALGILAEMTNVNRMLIERTLKYQKNHAK